MGILSHTKLIGSLFNVRGILLFTSFFFAKISWSDELLFRNRILLKFICNIFILNECNCGKKKFAIIFSLLFQFCTIFQILFLKIFTREIFSKKIVHLNYELTKNKNCLQNFYCGLLSCKNKFITPCIS